VNPLRTMAGDKISRGDSGALNLPALSISTSSEYTLRGCVQTGAQHINAVRRAAFTLAIVF
jgi:hypothetical protein